MDVGLDDPRHSTHIARVLIAPPRPSRTRRATISPVSTNLCRFSRSNRKTSTVLSESELDDDGEA